MQNAGDTRLDPQTKSNPDEDGVFGARTDPTTFIDNLTRESISVARASIAQLFIIPLIVFFVSRHFGANAEFWTLFVLLGLGFYLVSGTIGALIVNFRLQKYDFEVFMRTIITRLWEIEKIARKE